MNLLNAVQQWREQRNANPRDKIKVLGKIGSFDSAPLPRVNVPSLVLEVTPTKKVERAEGRLNIEAAVMLIGRHGKLGVEKAITENVSVRGARVISSCEWYADDTILISLPASHFTSAARVVYCDTLSQGRYAMGLEFVGSSKPLELTALARVP
jgi:hypothetical protein